MPNYIICLWKVKPRQLYTSTNQLIELRYLPMPKQRNLQFKQRRPIQPRMAFALAITALLLVSVLLVSKLTASASKLQPATAQAISSNTDRPVQVYTFDKQEIEKPEGYLLAGASNLPDYIINGEKLTIRPTKYDVGTVDLKFYRANLHTHQIDTITYQVTTKPVPFDKEKLLADIRAKLGDKVDNYGVYIYDLQRDETVEINSDQQIPPGSISKLPVAILTLRDIDAGTATFNTTYPVQNKYKHSTYDSIGMLPEGTQVSLKTYLQALILQSNNSAQYHLRERLGSTGVLNTRTHAELGVNPFFEDPHIATAKNIGTVLTRLYRGELLSAANTDFLLGLMTSIDPSSGLRNGIPYGLRNRTTIKIANKVGFLFGGNDNVYNDSAIVWAPRTDYVVVIMNKQAPPFPNGSQIIAQLSPIIYDALQNWSIDQRYRRLYISYSQNYYFGIEWSS